MACGGELHPPGEALRTTTAAARLQTVIRLVALDPHALAFRKLLRGQQAAAFAAASLPIGWGLR